MLDLNGVLCVCEERRFMSQGQRFSRSPTHHSATLPTIVGPKGVFVRPDANVFLRNVSRFTDITVWSSMRADTVQQLCTFLFRDVRPPVNILAQENCDRIMLRSQSGSLRSLKVQGTSKDVLLKTLSKTLYPHFSGRYTPENTIVIDDSPEKHILNSDANVVLAESWSHRGDGRHDSFLMDELGPWLHRLHRCQDLGLSAYRAQNALGRPMLDEVGSNPSLYRILEAISESERMGFKYGR